MSATRSIEEIAARVARRVRCPGDRPCTTTGWLIVLVLAGCVGCAIAAEPTPFDGAWKVTLVCPPHESDDEDAKGYTHRFTVQVVEGELRGTYGEEGEPGWHLLHGRVRADGTAALRLDGVVKNAAYAARGGQRGKPYSYRVRARFEGEGGIGQRLSGRACEFRFAR